MLPEQFQATEGYLYNLPQSEQVMSLCVILSRTLRLHSCQPLLGVNLSPVFMNPYFPYAGQGLLLFRWWQQRFEFQLACVAVEGKSSDVQNTHAQLKISLLMRFLSLLPSVHLAMACVSCSFDSFSIFLLSLKQQQNILKKMFCNEPFACLFPGSKNHNMSKCSVYSIL